MWPPNDPQEEDRRRDELRLLSLAINETDRAVLVLDEHRRIVYTNRAFTVMFGYTRDEVLGKRPTEFLAGEHTDLATLQRIREKAWNKNAFNDETLFYRKDGREIWTSAHVNHVLDEKGNVQNLIVVFADMTETKQIQRLQRVVLEAVASNSSLREVADLLCRQVEAIAPEVVSSMILVDSEKRLRPLAGPSLPSSYSGAVNGLPIGKDAGSCGTAAYSGEPVCVADIETDWRWAPYKSLVLPYGLRACWSSPIKMRDGRVAGTFTFFFREKRGPSPLHKELVSACLHLCVLAIERDEAKRQIEQLSLYDSLTGLPNRTSLYGITNELLREIDEDEIAFFALDIDRFKDVNSTLGHSAGERILVETAARLKKLSQPSGIVCRTVGDSFVLVVPRCNASRASAMADKILRVLKEPIDTMDMRLSISASIGITLADDDSIPAQALIEQAMTALHQAKLAGRASYHFYHPEMNKLAQDRLLLGAALRNAISQGSLELYYQPQFRLKTLEFIGVEALLRWKDPELGNISPEQFIPLAEEIGQIEFIGCWSLREACRQLSIWRDQGIIVPAVSVNLSPSHFRSRNLPAFVSDLLEEYHMPATHLTIEITEGVMMDSHPESLEAVSQLHDIGVGLSIDDFGTGFSSLARLTRLPITELKLDRSFMRNFETDPGAQAVATAVIRIGQSLGMTVVAEGVETEAQAKLLTSLGCDAVQGYLYGRPMPSRDLEKWIATAVTS
ncbi:EAL domain-containing protein [Edaphobacter modestus]|uniref:Diguanylate cyclase/phosphodiesterase with PAS/PAC sensor(S) n=1 Tax=Edaphobacter modestus TaxID=388466 RepID=A0A4Q7YSN2_9BACT|nr:EAL domain-containing protein [Edaphobacter modestus]RZU40011.1 diguanylate cyclase/phosphodiesterase with PAS/PAC sensor(s) [Edaphobacter modestus]